MTDSAATMATLFSHLNRLFKTLVPDQVSDLVSGTSKLVVLAPGQKVVHGGPGVDAALRLLKNLTPDEETQLAEPKGSNRSATARPQDPPAT